MHIILVYSLTQYIHLNNVHMRGIVIFERRINMPIIYKMDALQELKEAGYSTYRIRKERLMGEATLQKIRKGEPISWDVLAMICHLLHCQPGDLIEFRE